VVGKSYQAAVRLSVTATSNWRAIDGYYSGQGVDLLALPWDRFLNVIYAWAMEHQSDEDAQRWAAELDLPLPGSSSSSDELDPNEMDQLNNL
jgi:hypothetical protein